ncbi:XRE family transcriptional regulator [Fusobacterium necrophorum subsp. funduliforme]|uniref:DNA polymerase n=1 Tax=Fusobacterium necrophorum TaxID=859 RepID=UPI000787F772|nr:DNA polymerase [Fusobacterium necrophorum]KYM65494.1 XRE family transcriptional regulator [Fusobacterium necrophorum subsp. funduliforme]
MNTLSIDIETYSSIDIKKAGAYKYAQSDDFEILLFAYSFNHQAVQIIDLKSGESIPEEILSALQDRNCIKYAYNAAFEWWCLNQAGIDTPLDQWRCTMVHGLYCGYTAGLGATGAAIGLPQDKRKLATGTALIRYFCVPCKPTKSNGNRTRNLPHHAPEKWELFKEYCLQDVVTEMAIADRLLFYPVPEREWLLWRYDVAMNAFGVKIDRRLVEGALAIDAEVRQELMSEAMRITGLNNPNSSKQLMEWLEKQGEEVENLQKGTVSQLVGDLEDGDVKRVLEIRQELSKTSIKKYQAMQEAAGRDDRIRGVSFFYGANRTGRYAGRLVQLQNLPRNYLETLDVAREFTRQGNGQALSVLYGNVPDTLSQLIRTAFIPSEGHQFVVSDFSAIEARVIAWLAGEEWRMEVFKTHGKIYEASASQMFGVPLNTIVKGHENYALRAKGKVAELALGYQGSVGALIAMGADKMGLTEHEMKDIVSRWRNTSKRIVELWYALENAAVDVITTGQKRTVKCVTLAMEFDVTFGQEFLTILLPSGRKLFYPKPHLRENQFGSMQMHYKGINQTSKKWEIIPTYGGKLTENIVQAIARDCLTETLLRVKQKGWQVVFHVHDEIILDAPKFVSLEDVERVMGEPIPWAPGLILKAAGFVSDYYMKD